MRLKFFKAVKTKKCTSTNYEINKNMYFIKYEIGTIVLYCIRSSNFFVSLSKIFSDRKVVTRNFRGRMKKFWFYLFRIWLTISCCGTGLKGILGPKRVKNLNCLRRKTNVGEQLTNKTPRSGITLRAFVLQVNILTFYQNRHNGLNSTSRDINFYNYFE